MGKWIKVSGEPVQVRLPRREKWLCDFGEEHFGVAGTCMCADAPEDEEVRPAKGIVHVRNTRKAGSRASDGKTHHAIGYTRAEARKNGLTVRTKSRKKPPAPNAPMWEMDNEQRRRAASRARSM